MTCVSSPGREQAELTGQRLAALGLKYDVLIHSSMARATETANIISKHLPGSEWIDATPLFRAARSNTQVSYCFFFVSRFGKFRRLIRFFFIAPITVSV